MAKRSGSYRSCLEDDKENTPRRNLTKQSTKKTPCPAKEAADQMIKDLKKDLLTIQNVLESTTKPDDDLLLRNYRKAQLQIKQLTAKNKEILEAMRELPAIVQKLKEISEQLSSTSSRESSGSTPVQTPVPSELLVSAPASPSVASDDMVPLVPGSDIKVPRQRLKLLRTSSVSFYIGDLAVLVYGKETLSRSTLRGTQLGAHKDIEPKLQLDGTKLDAIIDHVLLKFPGTSVQEVRKIVGKKCYNESYKQAATKKTMDI